MGQRHLTPSSMAVEEGSKVISTLQNLHLLADAMRPFDLRKACSFMLSLKIWELMNPKRPTEEMPDISVDYLRYTP